MSPWLSTLIKCYTVRVRKIRSWSSQQPTGIQDQCNKFHTAALWFVIIVEGPFQRGVQHETTNPSVWALAFSQIKPTSILRGMREVYLLHIFPCMLGWKYLVKRSYRVSVKIVTNQRHHFALRLATIYKVGYFTNYIRIHSTVCTRQSNSRWFSDPSTPDHLHLLWTIYKRALLTATIPSAS